MSFAPFNASVIPKIRSFTLKALEIVSTFRSALNDNSRNEASSILPNESMPRSSSKESSNMIRLLIPLCFLRHSKTFTLVSDSINKRSPAESSPDAGRDPSFPAITRGSYIFLILYLFNFPRVVSGKSSRVTVKPLSLL